MTTIAEKYSIHKAIDTLSDEAKTLVHNAIVEAEKNITTNTVKANWQTLVIIIMAFAMMYIWHQKNNAQTALVTAQETIAVKAKVDAIEKTLVTYEQNVKDVYPKIDETVASLDAANSQIRALNNKITTMSQAQFRTQVKSLTTDQLIKEVSDLGYNITVINNGSGGGGIK